MDLCNRNTTANYQPCPTPNAHSNTLKTLNVLSYLLLVKEGADHDGRIAPQPASFPNPNSITSFQYSETTAKFEQNIFMLAKIQCSRMHFSAGMINLKQTRNLHSRHQCFDFKAISSQRRLQFLYLQSWRGLHFEN